MAKMYSWRVLDGLLRGNLEKDKSPVRALVFWQIALAGFYGICLGTYSLTGRDGGPEFRFMLTAAVKLPVLIVGTTAVTFPSLYVFLALFRIRMGFRQMVGIVLAANTILATVIASLGPILAFFSFTSSSYAFILLLNVAICGLGGVLGIRLMLLAIGKALPGAGDDLSEESAAPAGELDEEAEGGKMEQGSDQEQKPQEASADSPAALIRRQRLLAEQVRQAQSGFGAAAGARGIMFVWLFLYGFVGTQMAWILRPFIGHPEAGFALFRAKAGSFIDGVMSALGQYFGNGGM